MTKLALCLEYPLRHRGGVSVIVETLLEGLRGKMALVLVSPDRSAIEAGLRPEWECEHLFWDPVEISAATSRSLVGKMKALGVQLAHFHFGGNYGWGIRFPGQSPISYAARAGMRVFATDHLVVNILAGYCGPQKPFWFKLAMLPIAWLGKVQALRCVAAEIAVSDHDCRKLRQWYWPLRGRYRRIYHSRLEERLIEGKFEQRKPIVLSVGHLAFRKGQHVLAEGFARLASRHPDWTLRIVGAPGLDGCDAELRRIVTAHGLTDRIELLGERSDVAEMMRVAGIFVQPSRHEALGLALQEALWLGCPAIGTRAGGIPELIEHQRNGWLVPPDDPAALAVALDRLMSDEGERERLARAARSSILGRGMTAAQMLAKHTQLYASFPRA